MQQTAMKVHFWGVRGTLPVPGRKTVRYGGNTSCITLVCGKAFFIFDAGTGIKELSDFLVRGRCFPLHARIFISHPHYDHINGLPFFVPLYMQQNSFEFLGTVHGRKKMKNLIEGQMDAVYFPVTISEFSAKLKFRHLAEETFLMDGLRIATCLLVHPGGCMGYRITDEGSGSSFAYVTDNELFPRESPRHDPHQDEKLTKFLQGTDLAVMDATYTDAEYKPHEGWGHSTVARAMEIAHCAGVKVACLYHHSPDQTDADIDGKVKFARSFLKSLGSKTRVIAPREGEDILV